MEKTFNIIEEFKKFIHTLDTDDMNIFEYYCLGDRHNNASYSKITLNEYLNILKKVIQTSSNLGYRFVTYKTILTKKYERFKTAPAVPIKLALDEEMKAISSHHINDINEDYYSTLFISDGCKSIHYKFSFEMFHQNTGLVFLIHPDIISIDTHELLSIVSKWDNYIRSTIFINPYYTNTRYVFFNSKLMLISDKPVPSKILQKYRINRYYKQPLLINFVYEEERS